VSFSGRNADSLPPDDAELWLTLATSVASPQGGPLSDEDKEFARAMEWAEEEDLEFGDDFDDETEDDTEPDELSAAIAAVCALDHFDWLAVMSALVTGGPGTPASAADLARYVRDFDPEQVIGLAAVDNDFTFAPAVAAVADADDSEDYADVEVAVDVEADDEAEFDQSTLMFDDADFADDFADGDDLDDEEFDELSIEELFLNVTAMWSVLGAIDSDDRLTPLGWWGLPEAMSRAWTESEAD